MNEAVVGTRVKRTGATASFASGNTKVGPDTARCRAQPV